jgi:hypothetical protein
MSLSPNQNKHDTIECDHNLVGVTDNVSDNNLHMNGSEWPPLLPTDFISSWPWVYNLQTII